ncbi:hypothetical protein Tmar_1724 [Thermaerobacter marianensis DSM 12885]|uniref:Uncharacterized protein n=1 Tax=Thermaerobacter marianensis (strain ATCC 700841 / DSM 12885 / JCM 10246 / 7p75a) TaxID=644966 RepID=E6SHN6_THEM7|nr:hypothetical protein [Thermaerobacter marianensis]ADU51831.1 hypothetical protein Tmar_1724 [Thermaerobacter marianensis DSM 12885]
MTPFSRLLWREARQALPATAAFLVAILTWYAFLATRVGRWHDGLVIGMSQMPLWWLPPWAVWRTYQSLKNDLDSPHAYLLLSLPVRGWQLAGAKLLAVWIELGLYTAAAYAGLANTLLRTGIPGLPPRLSDAGTKAFVETLVGSAGMLFLLLVVFAVPAWLVLVQAAWAAGHAARRGRYLVTGLTFLVGSWLLLRIAIAGASLLAFLPPVPALPFPNFVGATGGAWAVERRWLALPPGPWLAVVTATWLGFFLTARGVERALDAEGARGPVVAVAAGAAVAAIDLYLNGVTILNALLKVLEGRPV